MRGQAVEWGPAESGLFPGTQLWCCEPLGRCAGLTHAQGVKSHWCVVVASTGGREGEPAFGLLNLGVARGLTYC